MTRQEHSTALEQVVELVTEQGSEATASVFATLLEVGMKLEREQALGAQADPNRAEATLTDTSRRPSTHVPVERPSRCPRRVASSSTPAPSRRAGISTRKVTDVMRELCGLDVSSSQVSRAAQELDEELQAWRAREIGQVTYLILDARYEKVRHGESCFAGLRRTPRQAILSEIDEEWATGRHYLNMEPV